VRAHGLAQQRAGGRRHRAAAQLQRAVLQDEPRLGVVAEGQQVARGVVGVEAEQHQVRLVGQPLLAQADQHLVVAIPVHAEVHHLRGGAERPLQALGIRLLVVHAFAERE
jgi:hypothetical protein